MMAMVAQDSVPKERSLTNHVMFLRAAF